MIKNIFPSSQSKIYQFKEDAIKVCNAMLRTPVFSFLSLSHDNAETVFSQEAAQWDPDKCLGVRHILQPLSVRLRSVTLSPRGLSFHYLYNEENYTHVKWWKFKSANRWKAPVHSGCLISAISLSILCASQIESGNKYVNFWRAGNMKALPGQLFQPPPL